MSEGVRGGPADDEGFFWESEKAWAFANSPDNNNWGGIIASEEKQQQQQEGMDYSSREEVIATEVAAQPTGKTTTRSDNNKNKKGTKKGGGGGGGDEASNKGSAADHEQQHLWTERERRKKMRTMFATLHSLLPHLPSKVDKSTIVDEAVKHIATLQDTLQKLEKQKMERNGNMMTMMMMKMMNESRCSSSSSSPLRNLLDLHHQQQPTSSREAFLADHGAGSSSGSSTPITASSSSSSPLSMMMSSIIPRFPVKIKTFTCQNVALNVCGEAAHISVCSPKKAGLLTAICYVCEKHKLEVVSAQVSSDHYRIMLMIHVHVNNGGHEQFSEAFPVEEVYKQAAAEMMLWVTTASS